MTKQAIRAEMIRIGEQDLAPLYRTLQTRRLEVRAAARLTHSRRGYAELDALRAEIAALQHRVCDLRGQYAAAGVAA